MRRQRNRHYFNEFNQNLEGKKNLICRRFSKKNFPSGNFVQQRQRNPTEKRASSMHVQSVQNVFLVNIKGWTVEKWWGWGKSQKNFFPQEIINKKYIPTDFGQKNMPKEDLCR